MNSPTTRYARIGDVHIAYQVVGDGPVDLVIAPGFVTHCDLNWTLPAYVDFIERLAGFARVILYDKRGTGLSDVSFDAASYEVRMTDLGAVMDAAGSERAALFGYSEGGPITALFAATHPERVQSLVLFGTFPSGRCIPADMKQRLDDAIDHWGEGRTADIFLSESDRSIVGRLMGLYERMGASPGAARVGNQAVGACDVTPILSQLHVPTAVIHRRDDPFALADWGRAMAELIPDAHYIEIDGEDHLPWMGDTDPIAEAVETHVTGRVGPRASQRTLATVLFTDVVRSTATLAAAGDERWAQIIQRHNDFCRGVFDEVDAWAVKSTGDGFMACFTTPESAVRCAQRILAAMPDLGVVLRAGLHTGELERVDLDDVAGMTPTLASRIADLAEPNELLSSRLTSDLLIGSQHTIRPHGVHDLKGVPQPVEVVSIEAPSPIDESDDFSISPTRRDRIAVRMARRAPTPMRALLRLVGG